MLRVPVGVRQLEDAEKTKREARLKELRDAKVDLSKISQADLQSTVGDESPEFKAVLQYTQSLKSMRASGREARAAALEALHAKLAAWRKAKAEAEQMAPASVFGDHVLCKLCHVKPTTIEGINAVRRAPLHSPAARANAPAPTAPRPHRRRACASRAPSSCST